MTDRHAGYVVVLDTDIREDDAEGLMLALRALRGVLTVEPVIGSIEQTIADQRARHQYWDAFSAILRKGLT